MSTLRGFINEEWFDKKEKKTVWFSLFRIFGKKKLDKGFLLKGSDCCIALINGKFEYDDVIIDIIDRKDDNLKLGAIDESKKELEGNICIISVPVYSDHDIENRSIEKFVFSKEGLMASIIWTACCLR